MSDDDLTDDPTAITDSETSHATQSVLRCPHEWNQRNQGPGFAWSECWLCGEMSDYK